MVAIRRDEDLDNIHSVYVDQWDWEKIISKEERTMETLINTVRSIYSVLRKTEKYMAVQYDYIEEILPKEIAFVSTQELVDMYPDLTPKEREYKIVKERTSIHYWRWNWPVPYLYVLPSQSSYRRSPRIPVAGIHHQSSRRSRSKFIIKEVSSNVNLL